jgi:bifunctional DNA-binding transcriptional regulator/antitoxin component of YhaV-PrlF toxin-antitoxin module
MPQLVKGGKYAFGWSRVGDNGRVDIPPEALAEYGFNELDKLILLPGSRTSGGFGLASQSALFESPLGAIAEIYPRLWSFQTSEGEVVEYKEKPYCWVALKEGCILVPPGTLEQYGIKIGDKLLVIRGSGRALGFAVRGPIVEEAKRHGELEVF